MEVDIPPHLQTMKEKGDSVSIMDDRHSSEAPRNAGDVGALLKEEENCRVLLDESSDPIFSFYPDGSYRYVNKAFAEGVRRSQEEIIGAHISDIFPPEEAEKRFAIVQWVFENADTRVIEVRVPRPDGDHYYITTAKPVLDSDGTVASVICISKNITDRKLAECALRESEERYRSFVKNFPGIAYRGSFQSWTPEFFHGKVESITGYHGEDFVAGNPRWDQIVHPDDLETLRGKDELSSVPGFSAEREYRIIRRDGEIRWIYETTQNICDGDEEILYIQGTILDITKRKRFEEALEVKNERLLELDRMKDSLLHDVAHEMKTPVAKHTMQIEILKALRDESKLSEAEKKAFHVIGESIRRQESVIRNFLDLSRLESGGRTYKKEAVSLDALFSVLRSDYQHAVYSYGVEIAIDVPAIVISSDEEMLQHVFSNLMNNAIKFRRKSVPLKVKISAAVAGGEVIVRMTDNGGGIDPEEMEKVFTRFYQLSPALEGSGIGLAICRRITEDLGGRISMSPNAETGISVNVALPLGQDS